ncbi:MAG TPA: dienelactone hydrolase family protein [Blastocatellia bacterium]|nr:dienelactone hydrolase family protein [Blastocatellia bacterium]
MSPFSTTLMLVTSFLALTPCSADKISRQTFLWQGKQRAYYLFVPDGVNKDKPAPLVVTLHGSGRNGLSLVEKWKDLASKEGIMLAGPDSLNTSMWSVPEDGPDFLYDLVEWLKASYPVNPRRVYLFGHSAGAVFALDMAMYESEYFSAVAIHAGAWRDPTEFDLLKLARRKTPIKIVVGDQDAFFPLVDVKATEAAFKAAGFPIDVNVMKGHTHNYYAEAGKINIAIWDFLKTHELAGDPKYQQYEFKKR